MKRTLLVILVILSFCLLLNAQEDEKGLKWSGYLQVDHRMFTKDGEFSFKEYRLDLQSEYKASENTKFFSEIWVRSLGFSSVSSSVDLFIKENISPVKFEIREAYFDIYGFLTKNLDIRIGRQRIAWGTADRINPTDNINPDDLEDIWDLGRHLGSDGIKATYYLKGLTIQGIFIPNFIPSVPPLPGWSSALIEPFTLPDFAKDFKLRNVHDRIVLPENNLKENMIAGLKLSTNIGGYDLSISYLYGRDDLPILKYARIESISPTGEIDVVANLIYPRIKVIGSDFSGSLGEVGIWGEAGLFFPEEVKLKTSYLGLYSFESTALSDNPYLKYALGFDYTFRNGIYINTQYIHGFIHERGKENLEDYITIQVEWKLFHDKLKLIPVSGAVEIKDGKNFSYIYYPSIEYRPFENAMILIGARLINSKGTSNFGKLKDMDEIWVKAKYSF
ncbi:MAG: DUF1302 family protein [Candidatus Aminicenantia bacterium]